LKRTSGELELPIPALVLQWWAGVNLKLRNSLSMDSASRRHYMNDNSLNGPRLSRPAVSGNVAGEMVSEEALVKDARAGLTPAQMVERRLVTLLQHTPLPVSRLQSGAQRRAFP
jgi:hypothetical protein